MIQKPEVNLDAHQVIPLNEHVFADRSRTNFFKRSEQELIRSLVQHLPLYLTPNKLTFIGSFGSLLVFSAFILAKYYDSTFLIIGILGLAVNWFGDSLDGRLAYYRNVPRKWYGFALDLVMDWIAILAICLGYFFYAAEPLNALAVLLVFLYGWSIIIALIRYKITDSYTIDSGSFGPTELRVIIAVLLLFEIIWRGSLSYFAILISLALIIVNVLDTTTLLKSGDLRDQEEKLK